MPPDDFLVSDDDEDGAIEGLEVRTSDPLHLLIEGLHARTHARTHTHTHTHTNAHTCTT